MSGSELWNLALGVVALLATIGTGISIFVNLQLKAQIAPLLVRLDGHQESIGKLQQVGNSQWKEVGAIGQQVAANKETLRMIERRLNGKSKQETGR